MSVIGNMYCKCCTLGIATTRRGEFGRIWRFGERQDQFWSGAFRRWLYSRSANLTIMLFLSTWWAAPMAVAQPLPSDFNQLKAASASTDYSSGWWSPKRDGDPIQPTLLVTASANTWTLLQAQAPGADALNLSDRNIVWDHPADTVSKQSAGSYKLRFLLLPSRYRLTMGITEKPHFGSDAGNGNSTSIQSYSLLTQLNQPPGGDSFLPDRLLDKIETNYVWWEQRLADSRTLTDERGMHLYPLSVVAFGRDRLPILLYVPPVRGTR
jgi:hypothetical protein